MDVVCERCASVLDDQTLEFANMRIPDRGRNVTVGHDASEENPFDLTFAQHPFQPRHVEGRVGDLLYGDVSRCKCINELLTPASRREVAFGQKWPQGFEVR